MDLSSQTQNQAPRAVSATAQAGMPLSENAMGALGYFCGIAAVVALLVSPYNTNSRSRFHAIQALLFQGSLLVGHISLAIVFGLLSLVVSTVFGALHLYAVSGVFYMISPIVSLLFSLAALAGWITMIVATAQGRDLRIPILGQYAEKLSMR